MIVLWQASEFRAEEDLMTSSERIEGLYYINSRSYRAKVSLLTPLFFGMRCRVRTQFYVQLSNFTRTYKLYQKGLFFMKPSLSKKFSYSRAIKIRILRKSGTHFNQLL